MAHLAAALWLTLTLVSYAWCAATADFSFSPPYSLAVPRLRNETEECARLTGFEFDPTKPVTVAQLSRMCDKPSCAALLNEINTLMDTSASEIENPRAVNDAYWLFAHPMLNYCWYFRVPGEQCPPDPWMGLFSNMPIHLDRCVALTKFPLLEERNSTVMWGWLMELISNEFGSSSVCKIPVCRDIIVRLFWMFALFACPRDKYTELDEVTRETILMTTLTTCIGRGNRNYTYQHGPSLPLNLVENAANIVPAPSNDWSGSISDEKGSWPGSRSSSSSFDGQKDPDVGDPISSSTMPPQTVKPLKTVKPPKTMKPQKSSKPESRQTTQPNDSIIEPTSVPTTPATDASQTTDEDATDGSSNPSAAIAPGNINTATSSSANDIQQMVAIPLATLLAVGVVLIFVQNRRMKRRKSQLDDEAQYLAIMNTPHTGQHHSDHRMMDGHNEDASLLSASAISNSWGASGILLRKAVPVDCIKDVRLIGTGGHGVVFLVRDTRDNSLLASKRLVRNHQTKEKIELFVAEIQLHSTLEHPCVVSFVGATWTNRCDVQALFEYMDGGDLRTHLDVTPWCGWSAEKLSIAIDVADALAYVHSVMPSPVVHRDLKSRNVLLSLPPNGTTEHGGQRDGGGCRRAKLSDFGVARRLSQHNSMTTGVGTSRWLAPEVIIGGGEYDASCDVYSFGVVLSELDTHRVPFADCFGAVPGSLLPEIAILSRVGLEGLQPSFSESCPVEVLELARRCLSFDSRQRPSAVVVAEELRRIRPALIVRG